MLEQEHSETPAAAANWRVVVPLKPFSTKTVLAVLMMDARRSSPEIFVAAFIPSSSFGL